MADATAIEAVSFRRATLGDIPQLIPIIAAENLPPLFVAEFIDGFIAAERDGEIVGCGGVEMYDEHAVIRSVVVAPSGRGQGLGRLLCDRLEADARASSATNIYLFTADALEFWKHRGYVEVTFEEWARPPRLCWQYQFLSQNRDLAGTVHPMWRKA